MQLVTQLETECFSALLANKGMTGPKPVFEGERGFFRQVSGEFELESPKNEYKT